MTFSGETVVAADEGHDLSVWRISDGRMARLREWTAAESTILSLTTMPDRSSVLVASTDGTVARWDVSSGECLGRASRHAGRATGAVAAPDGSTILSCGDDNRLRIWHVGEDREVAGLDTLEPIPGQRATTRSLAVSPEGDVVAAGVGAGTIGLWRTGSLEKIGRLTGHRDRVLRISFAAGGRRLVSISMDGTLRIWDLEAHRLLEMVPIQGQAEDLAVSADHLAVASGDGRVLVRPIE